MQIVRKTLAVFLSLWLIAPSAGAQQTHVADRATLEQAVAATAAQAQADRETIRRVLARQEVKDVASRLGVDLTRADSAIRLLDGAELAQAAQYASQIDEDLAGGATTLVLTATTIIIILLIVIIIILLAD